MNSEPGECNLALLAERAQERLGDYDSLCFEGRWHSSAEIHERSGRAGAGLRRLGVEPGDRVVVMMMNTPEVFIGYRAIWRAGAVVTPVIFLQTEPELRHILTDSGARAAIVTPELLPLMSAAADSLDIALVVVGEEADREEGTVLFSDLEDAEAATIHPRQDDDLAALLYTGGTTGRAKGVMLSHRGLFDTGRGLEARGRQAEADRGLLPLPLSHVYGLIVMVAGLHSERRTVSVLQRWFEPTGWLELVAEHRLEFSPVVPSMLQMLLAQPVEDYDLSSLLYFGSGGAPLPPPLRDEVERRLGAIVLEGYGCTESSAVISSSTMEENRPHSVGKPLPHVDLELRGPDGAMVAPGETGEICVRGPGVMQGYWHDEEQTRSTVVDGWLHTGDLGRLDEDGYLYVVDRIKDLIIRGGFNVYPRDVEDVLLDHPDVAAAAVVGRSDDRLGEEVVAVVSLALGASATPEELMEHARAHLAAHKCPREIRIVDAVPLTSVGKTDRKTVRAFVSP